MTDQPHGPSLRAAGLAALVTGGAAGIGAAVVRLLHQEGARVHVADVDQDAYVRTIPLGRRGAPHEVARAALYLASGESVYVTGTNLVVDGGIAAGRQAT